MSSSRVQALAAAAVELFGAIANASIAAGLVNLAIAAVRTDFEPDLKQIRARLTGLVSSKHRSMTSSDREALVETMAEALRAITIDEELVRATARPERFRRLVGERSAAAMKTVREDPATRDAAESMSSIVCDWIIEQIKRAPRFIPLRVDQLEGDARAVEQRARETDDRNLMLEARIGKHELQFVDLQDAVDRLRLADSARLASPTELFVSAVDHRPMPVRVVGREAEIDEVDARMGDAGVVVLVGSELSGRYEIARAWCGRKRDSDLTFALDFQSSSQLSVAVRALAADLAVDASGDVAVVLARLLWSRPRLSVVICGMDQSDLLARLVVAARPGAGALLITAPATTEVQRNTLTIDELSSEAVLRILEDELAPTSLPDLIPLAEHLRGLPESARVTAAMLRDAGPAAATLVRQLLTRASRIPDVPLSRADRQRTQSEAWKRSFQRFSELTGRDPIPLLAMLHVMRSRVLDGQLGVTCTLFLTDDPSKLVEMEPEYAMLRETLLRLGLMGRAPGMLTCQPMLAEYCWNTLGDSDRQAVVRACLGSARMAADRGRYSREIYFYYCAAWLQAPGIDVFRSFAPQSFDDSSIQLANLMAELDLREHAQAVLARLLSVQNDDPAANSWPAAIRMGNAVLETEAVSQGDDYVAVLEQELRSVAPLDPRDEAELWALIAKVRWRRSDLSGVLAAVENGEVALTALGDDDDRLAQSGLRRIRGWARVASGDIEPGLDDLREGYRLLEPSAGSPVLEEYRSETQTFLHRHDREEWIEWRDLQTTAVASPDSARSDGADDVRDPEDSDHPELTVIGVNSSWISVAAARAAGDLDAAARQLDLGLPNFFHTGDLEIYGIGQHSQAIWHAERTVHEAAFLLEAPGMPVLSDLVTMVDRLDAALEHIDSLLEEEQDLKRVRSWRNSLLIQKANVHVSLGQGETACMLARAALDSDEELYGPGDRECADDLVVLAGAEMATATHLADPSIDRARELMVRARSIYLTPGPEFDVPRVREIDEHLAMLPLG